MKRRTFIATSTVAATGMVGGCIGIPALGDRDAASTSMEDLQRDVSVKDSDAITGHEFDIEVELHSGKVDSESTARLKITKTNTGERRSIAIPQGPLFGWDYAESQPPGLWLYNDKTVTYARDYKADKRWTIRNDASYERHWLSRGARGPVTYEHGEAASTEYELWDDYLVEGYFPTGSYRFEGAFSIWESDEREGNEPTHLEWGFSIEVTE